ncbi:hypothetical protein G7054_g760 [Neopestalotiopsis clavispora]|nr:hypothetical protein G7054_g760 [Neopestalotiopsis clavispora]
MSDMTLELFRPKGGYVFRALDRSRDLCDDDQSGEIADQYALLTRYVPDDLPYHLDSIIVQSPYLRNFLAAVFKGYPRIYASTQQVEFSTPFHEFYFRWDKFLECMKEEQDETTLLHVRLLYEVMVKIIEPLKATVEDLLSNGLIDFEHVFALFEPRCEVYAKIDGHNRMFITTYHLNSAADLPCKYIDTNGKCFGWYEQDISVPQFEGVIPVQQLPCIPMTMLEDRSMRQRLVDRGREFEKLGGINYRAYSGIVSIRKEKVKLMNGRIIIDPAIGLTLDKDRSPFLVREEDAEDQISKKGQKLSSSRSKKVRALLTNDTELAVCAPQVAGYCLTYKGWAKFDVDNVKEITWDHHAFDALVLQPDVKQVILSFVQVQLSEKDRFDDIINGKGKGIIVLFQGEAGVGKTLTAESLAERIRQPLYIMSAGELGEKATEVEKNLRKVMDRCTTWRAILLLDECDVFLEKRSESSLEKNRLVAVFLRMLEYYQGVLLLTTNRISAFDPAFESRIHLTIDYPKLDREARQRIWANFINAQSRSTISAWELRLLGQLELNGRQIKNMVKTAALLATAENVGLQFDHIMTVAKVKGLELHQRWEEKVDHGWWDPRISGPTIDLDSW